MISDNKKAKIKEILNQFIDVLKNSDPQGIFLKENLIEFNNSSDAYAYPEKKRFSQAIASCLSEYTKMPKQISSKFKELEKVYKDEYKGPNPQAFDTVEILKLLKTDINDFLAAEEDITKEDEEFVKDFQENITSIWREELNNNVINSLQNLLKGRSPYKFVINYLIKENQMQLALEYLSTIFKDSLELKIYNKNFDELYTDELFRGLKQTVENDKGLAERQIINYRNEKKDFYTQPTLKDLENRLNTIQDEELVNSNYYTILLDKIFQAIDAINPPTQGNKYLGYLLIKGVLDGDASEVLKNLNDENFADDDLFIFCEENKELKDLLSFLSRSDENSDILFLDGKKGVKELLDHFIKNSAKMILDIENYEDIKDFLNLPTTPFHQIISHEENFSASRDPVDMLLQGIQQQAQNIEQQQDNLPDIIKNIREYNEKFESYYDVVKEDYKEAFLKEYSDGIRDGKYENLKVYKDLIEEMDVFSVLTIKDEKLKKEDINKEIKVFFDYLQVGKYGHIGSFIDFLFKTGLNENSVVAYIEKYQDELIKNNHDNYEDNLKKLKFYRLEIEDLGKYKDHINENPDYPKAQNKINVIINLSQNIDKKIKNLTDNLISKMKKVNPVDYLKLTNDQIINKFWEKNDNYSSMRDYFPDNMILNLLKDSKQLEEDINKIIDEGITSISLVNATGHDKVNEFTPSEEVIKSNIWKYILSGKDKEFDNSDNTINKIKKWFDDFKVFNTSVDSLYGKFKDTPLHPEPFYTRIAEKSKKLFIAMRDEVLNSKKVTAQDKIKFLKLIKDESFLENRYAQYYSTLLEFKKKYPELNRLNQFYDYTYIKDKPNSEVENNPIPEVAGNREKIVEGVKQAPKLNFEQEFPKYTKKLIEEEFSYKDKNLSNFFPLLLQDEYKKDDYDEILDLIYPDPDGDDTYFREIVLQNIQENFPSQSKTFKRKLLADAKTWFEDKNYKGEWSAIYENLTKSAEGKKNFFSFLTYFYEKFIKSAPKPDHQTMINTLGTKIEKLKKLSKPTDLDKTKLADALSDLGVAGEEPSQDIIKTLSEDIILNPGHNPSQKLKEKLLGRESSFFSEDLKSIYTKAEGTITQIAKIIKKAEHSERDFMPQDKTEFIKWNEHKRDLIGLRTALKAVVDEAEKENNAPGTAENKKLTKHLERAKLSLATINKLIIEGNKVAERNNKPENIVYFPGKEARLEAKVCRRSEFIKNGSDQTLLNFMKAENTKKYGAYQQQKTTEAKAAATKEMQDSLAHPNSTAIIALSEEAMEEAEIKQEEKKQEIFDKKVNSKWDSFDAAFKEEMRTMPYKDVAQEVGNLSSNQSANSNSSSYDPLVLSYSSVVNLSKEKVPAEEFIIPTAVPLSENNKPKGVVECIFTESIRNKFKAQGWERSGFLLKKVPSEGSIAFSMNIFETLSMQNEKDTLTIYMNPNWEPSCMAAMVAICNYKGVGYKQPPNFPKGLDMDYITKHVKRTIKEGDVSVADISEFKQDYLSPQARNFGR